MSMGYMGYAGVYLLGQDTGDPSVPGDLRLLLTTGSSVNLVLEPIYSAAVYGAGWYNAPTVAHYADAAIRYEGGIDFDFQASTVIWNFIRDWAIEQRAWPRSLAISPNGQDIYQYFVSDNSDNPIDYDTSFNNKGAWCTQLSLSTSQGSAVTASANVLAIYRTIGSGGLPYIQNRTGFILGAQGGQGPVNMKNLRPLNPSQANIDPIPFWKTRANLYAVDPTASAGAGNYNPLAGTPTPTAEVQSTTEPIQWSVQLNNNTVPLYTMNGTRFPSAVLQGAIDATGTVELFDVNGVFDPVAEALTAENTMFRVRIRTNSESEMSATYVYIDLPAVVVESDDFGIKGQSEPVTRSFNLKALGGRVDTGSTQVYPPMYMTLAS